MNLRVFRQYNWTNVSKMIGGRPQWSRDSHDTLQYMNDDGNWIDVPVVEDEIPERPDLQEKHRTSDEIDEWIKEHTNEIRQKLAEKK